MKLSKRNKEWWPEGKFNKQLQRQLSEDLYDQLSVRLTWPLELQLYWEFIWHHRGSLKEVLRETE